MSRALETLTLYMIIRPRYVTNNEYRSAVGLTLFDIIIHPKTLLLFPPDHSLSEP